MLLIACFLGGYSQTSKVAGAEITIGKPYQVFDAFYKIYIQKGGKILAFKRSMRALKMQLFDTKTLVELKSKEVADLPRGFEFECIKEFKGTYFLFFSIWDKPNKKEQLFCRQIDFDNFGFKGTDKLLVRVDGKVTDHMGSEGLELITSHEKFDVQTSYDSTKVLIQYRKKPAERNDKISKDIIGLFVYNNNMDPLYGKEYTMPYTEKRMDNIDYSIDSEGNVYTLATVYDNEKDKNKIYKDGKLNYHLELLIIENKSTEFKTSKITLGDNIVTNLSLFESPNKNMICAGFYADAKNAKSFNINDATGIFIFKTDKNGENKGVATYKIPLEILNQYISERAQAKNEKADKNDKSEFEDLVLRQLIVEDDGSIILIGEQYYVESYQNKSGSTGYIFYYNDILITKINANGQLAWMKKLPKRQVGGASQGGMSYKYINSGDYHYIVFLDNIKNMTLSINKYPAEHREGQGGYLTAFKVANTNG